MFGEIKDYFLCQKPSSRQNLTNGHELGNNDSDVQIFMTILMAVVALMGIYCVSVIYC